MAAARTAARGGLGRIRIGFIVGTQVRETSRILRAFRERCPGVDLELVEYTFADPSAGLNDGEVDVAFVMPPISHNGLSFEEVYHVPRVAVVSDGHPLAHRDVISVRELFDDTWIVAQTDDPICRDYWLAMNHRGGTPPKLGPATTSIDKFIQLVVAGEVVGLAAAWAEDAFSRPGVRFVPVSDVEPAVTALAWRPGAGNPLTERFLDIARERSG
jgi:DNA-binding transcriptional LysR family regulator